MLIRVVFAAFVAFAAVGPAHADDSLLNPAFLFNVFPTTDYTTLNCANFAKVADGAWKAVRRDEFRLGFVQHIIPPAGPIHQGAWVYNNVDLYSQLQSQCPRGVVARY